MLNMQRVFGAEPRRRQLPTVATTAGDHHALAGELRADRGPVELHRVAAEQIFDRDFLQFVETRAAGDDVFEPGAPCGSQVAAFAEIDRAAHLRLVRVRHRDDEHLGGRFRRASSGN